MGGKICLLLGVIMGKPSYPDLVLCYRGRELGNRMG
jgi:hypothetical protein